jgi:hypothetical protein
MGADGQGAGRIFRIAHRIQDYSVQCISIVGKRHRTGGTGKGRAIGGAIVVTRRDGISVEDDGGSVSYLWSQGVGLAAKIATELKRQCTGLRGDRYRRLGGDAWGQMFRRRNNFPRCCSYLRAER